MNANFKYNNENFCFCVHPETIEENGKKYPYDGVSRHLYKTGSFYDLETLEHSLQFINDKSVICDCGAMIGNHTVFWAKKVKKVYSFEPFEQNFNLLNDNILLNNLTNVESKQVVLDKMSKTFSPVRKSRHYGPIIFKEDKYGKYKSESLDNLVSEKVDLIKIDVEGSELDVLLGAKRILSYKPILYIEIHFIIGSKEHNDILNFLYDLGYKKDKDLFICDKWTIKNTSKK